MTNSSLPAAAGFLRLKQVLELYPVSARTWWAGVKTGRFPRPVKLGPRATGVGSLRYSGAQATWGRVVLLEQGASPPSVPPAAAMPGRRRQETPFSVDNAEKALGECAKRLKCVISASSTGRFGQRIGACHAPSSFS